MDMPHLQTRKDGRYKMKTPMPIGPRLWPKVNFDGPINSERPELGSCWLWEGSVDGNGSYGAICVNGRKRQVHRIAYELQIGPIPPNLEIDHLCRTTLCVRGSHMEPVTHRENVLRGKGLAAMQARKTHCHQGHPFSGSNLRFDRRGHRHCRTCERQRIKRG